MSTNKISPRLATWIIIGMSIILLEFMCRFGFFGATTLIAPSIGFKKLLYNLVKGNFISQVSTTFLEVAISFAVAFMLGVSIGIVFWKWERLGKTFEPYMVGMYAVPLIFFYPLLLYIFGLGQKPIIYIAVVHSTTPIVLNTWIGLKGVKEIFVKVARSVNCSRWQTYLKVVFPAATPRIFAGLKIGFIYAFVSCVAMEFILSEKGMGWMVKYDYEYFEPERMFGAIFLLVIIAVSMNSLLLHFEKRIRMEME
jgi:NitT/TauT family transport system permease protein